MRRKKRSVDATVADYQNIKPNIHHTRVYTNLTTIRNNYDNPNQNQINTAMNATTITTTII